MQKQVKIDEVNGANVPELMKKLKTHSPVTDSEAAAPEQARLGSFSTPSSLVLLSLSSELATEKNGHCVCRGEGWRPVWDKQNSPERLSGMLRSLCLQGTLQAETTVTSPKTQQPIRP